MNSIENINIIHLSEHPENPRRNIGDITELAESIKHSGIMQNLTVVPWSEAHPGKDSDGSHENKYTVIIGHRRYNAAIKAGVTELPCKIVHMDYKEQIATMLAENMQRVDLTVSEQVFGMQMMLDLGESVESVSERTGFSQSTIRRRVKIAELDRDKVLKAEEKGATIADLVEIASIDDEDERKELFKHIGTPHFKWACDNAKLRISNRAKENEWRDIFNSFANEVDEIDFDNYVRFFEKSLNIAKTEDFNIPKDANEIEYVYSFRYQWIYLYRKKTDEEIAASDQKSREKEIAEQKRKEAVARLEAVDNHCRESRLNFIRNYRDKNGDIAKIISFYCVRYLNDYRYINMPEIIKTMGIEVDEFEKDKGDKQFADLIEKYPAMFMLAAAYVRTETSYSTCYDYYGKYKSVAYLEEFYKLLEKIGYVMADEERAYLNGSHEDFAESETS